MLQQQPQSAHLKQRALFLVFFSLSFQSLLCVCECWLIEASLVVCVVSLFALFAQLVLSVELARFACILCVQKERAMKYHRAQHETMSELRALRTRHQICCSTAHSRRPVASVASTVLFARCSLKLKLCAPQRAKKWPNKLFLLLLLLF